MEGGEFRSRVHFSNAAALQDESWRSEHSVEIRRRQARIAAIGGL